MSFERDLRNIYLSCRHQVLQLTKNVIHTVLPLETTKKNKTRETLVTPKGSSCSHKCYLLISKDIYYDLCDASQPKKETLVVVLCSISMSSSLAP